MGLSDKKFIISVGFLLLTTPSLCFAGEQLRVACGSFVARQILKMKGPLAEKSGIQLKMLREDGMGADTVLLAVDSGRADVGVIGVAWPELLEVVKEKKLLIKNLDHIEHEAIGQNRVLFFTYRGGPKNLSSEQIRRLFVGEVKNWKELDAEDLPVQLVILINSPGTQKDISVKLLRGKDIYRKGIKMVDTYPQLITYVANHRGSVSFAPKTVDLGSVNVPKQPEFSKTVTAVTLGPAREKAKKFIEIFKANSEM